MFLKQSGWIRFRLICAQRSTRDGTPNLEHVGQWLTLMIQIYSKPSKDSTDGDQPIYLLKPGKCHPAPSYVVWLLALKNGIDQIPNLALKRRLLPVKALRVSAPEGFVLMQRIIRLSGLCPRSHNPIGLQNHNNSRLQSQRSISCLCQL